MMAMFFTPFRTRTAHVMPLGVIGPAKYRLRSTPKIDRRRHRTGCREDNVSEQLGR